MQQLNCSYRWRRSVLVTCSARRALPAAPQPRRRAQVCRASAGEPGNGEQIDRRRTDASSALPCGCCRPLLGSLQRKPRNALYDKFFAAGMSYMSETYDKLVKPIKQDIFADLVNALATQSTAVNAPDRPLVILEVGIGAAPNLPYYAEAVAKAPVQLQQPVVVVGVDPNPEMLKGARETVTGAQLPPGWAVELFEGSAEALPFEDGSVDAVVVTTVLCSVPSPPAALSEIRRVLRPGGRLLLLEHVRAPEDKPLTRLAQAVLTPLQQAMGDGCSLTRETLKEVAQAGFETGGVRSLQVEGLSLFSSHIAGLARR